jgi:type I restriction enzyme S subunit
LRAPTVSLGEVSHSIVDGPFGSNLKISDYVETGVPVLQGKNITGDQFVWKEVRYVSPTKAKELARSSVEIGDHLVIKIGSIGYSAIIDHLNGHPIAIIPANLARIRPNRRLIDDRYLHHWLVSGEAKRYFVGVASTTAQPALSLTKIKEARLPLPPLDEQRRIAAILDEANALRRKRKRAIDLLDSLTQSIFREMFGFRKDPVYELKDVVKKGTIVTYGIVQAGPEFPGGIPYIRTGDLVDGNIQIGGLKRTDPALAARFSRSRVDAGDIVMSIRATVGTTAVVPPALEGANLTQGTARIAPGDNVQLHYLLEYIRTESTQRWIAAQVKGATFLEITLGRLRELPVAVPPLDLQNEFSNIVMKVRREQTRSVRQAALADSLFFSLQSRAFSGLL